MWVGIGIGINRNRYAQGIFNAYSARVVADGGVVEAGQCVNAVTGLLLNASLLLIPSGYKGGKLYAEIPTNGNGDLTWTRGSDAFRTNASGLIQRVPWNLLQQSNAFTTSPWSFVGTPTLTANYATNPLTGANDAWRFQSASSSHRVVQVISNSLTTFSVYAKGTGTIQLRDSTGNYTVDVALTSSWQRVSLYIPASFTNVQITSNGGCDATIYGAQLVEGTTEQTYLPTTDRLNFPRLSYMYGSCPAVLLEPQRTNLFTYSAQLDEVNWSKQNCTITANSSTAPDGTLSADLVDDGTAVSTQHWFFQSPTLANSTAYTISFYAKYVSRKNMTVNIYNGSTSRYVVYDIQNGVIVGSTGDVTASITSVGNGWYRVVYTRTMASSGSPNFRIAMADDTGSESYTGSNKQVLIWGLQLELGAYVTTPIPTTSATATRVADSFSRSNIYTNGLISASGGTWFVEFRNNIVYTRDVASAGLLLGNPSDGTTNSFFFLAGSPSRLSIFKRVSGVFTSLYLTTTDTTKIAIKWNGSTADIFANGTKVVSSTLFTATDMEFLSGNAGDVPKFIQQMALFNSPLSDAQCQTLTTL